MAHRYLFTPLKNEEPGLLLLEREGQDFDRLRKYIGKSQSEIASKLALKEDIVAKFEDFPNAISFFKEKVEQYLNELIINQDNYSRFKRTQPHSILGCEVLLNVRDRKDKHIYIVHVIYEILEAAVQNELNFHINYIDDKYSIHNYIPEHSVTLNWS